MSKPLVSGVAVILFGDQCVYLRTISSVYLPLISTTKAGGGDLLAQAETAIGKHFSMDRVSDLVHLGDTEFAFSSSPMMQSVFAAAVISGDIPEGFVQTPLDQENTLLGDWIEPAHTALFSELAAQEDEDTDEQKEEA